jgi:pimeloyl-ACP methyl ester carboxylesterase
MNAAEISPGSLRVDGARLNFLSTGAGPGVVVAPGALSTADDYTRFAAALGGSHRVHVLHRRGRGGSAPQGARYGIGQEAQDVCALLAQTGSEILIGHSFGGLVALEAARSRPNLRALILFEPGVSVAGSIPMSWIDPCRDRLAQGRPLDGFVTYVASTGPAAGRLLPAWVLKQLLARILPKPDLEQMLELLPQAIAEHLEIARLDSSTARYRGIRAPTLLLAGGATRIPYLARAIAALGKEMPNTETSALKSLDHFAMTNRGAPEIVAQAIRGFLAAL